jgi:hypothetical protein
MPTVVVTDRLAKYKGTLNDKMIGEYQWVNDQDPFLQEDEDLDYE